MDSGVCYDRKVFSMVETDVRVIGIGVWFLVFIGWMYINLRRSDGEEGKRHS